MAIKKPTYEELEIEVKRLRKLQESNLHANDTFENLTNSLTDIVFSVKMPERIIDWCNNSIRSIGYEPTEAIGKTTSFLYTDKENYLDFGKRLQQSLEEGKAIFETEQLFKKKNGDTFSADVRVTCDKEDGEIVRVTSIIRDISEQKETVEDLKNEKEFLEAVFDNITDGIVSCDANGILNRFNQTTKEFHGLPDIPIDAEHWAEHYDIFFPDGKTPMQMKDVPLFRALTEGIVQDAEMMIIPKNGKKRLLVSNGKILKDIDGKTLGAVVAMHDITEQRQVQQELKDSEIKYRALFDNAPLSYQSLDKDGRFIDINPSWLRTLGYERDEVIGKFYADFLHPDWTPHFEKNFPAFKKRGYVKDVHYKIKHKKGHFIDIAFEGCIGYLPDGSFKQTYCVFQDVTENKKAEEKLKMFNRVIDYSLNAFDIVNHKGEFVYANQAYADMWGYETTDEIIGTSPVPHCADENLAGRIIAEIKKNGKFISEIKAKRKDGSIFDALMYARLDHDENGNEIYPSTSLDITERKKGEEEILQSQKKYQSLFDNSPVPLWEEDFSGVKKYIETLQKRNISEFRDYFQNNPDELRACVQLVKIKDVNISVLKLNEAESKEELYNDLSSIFTDTSYEAFTEELITIAEGRMECEFESTVRTLKGNEKDVYLKWMVVPGYEDTLEKVYISTIDITERKELLKTLQQRNEYIESILGNMPIGFALNTISDGDVKFMNNEFESIYGWSKDILTNTSIFFEKVFPDPEYRAKILAEIIPDIESCDPDRMNWDDLKIVTSSGEERYIHGFNIPLPDQNLMISTVQDVTKRKLAEEELKKHRENLEELVDKRTQELEDKNQLLERINKAFVGRELKMKELKERIKKLQTK